MSQFRGPFALNMAETEEERKAREAKEKEDAEKRSNFDKVRDKAEREEKARKDAEAERDQLLKEKKDREEADKKAADDKLAAEKQFEQLAATREKEANDAKAAAAAAEARATEAEKKVKAIEDEQEKELEALLKTIPEDKKPPLDPTDSVAKRLAQAKYAASLLDIGPKPPIGTTPPKGSPSDDKAARLKELQSKPFLTTDEGFELVELSGK